tara:strand:- start:12 stop:668 length:657 start_codon:yes stop_codon:yes gene_type:complete
MDAFLDEALDAGQKTTILSGIGALPLAGGTMDAGADIAFANASAIREAGAQGLEIECSVGYRWQWVAGRMILRLINSGQIARILAIDETPPASSDDETQGFIVGTRWEIANGTIYKCIDATTDAAVWAIHTNGDLPEILAPSTALTISPPAGTYAVGYKHVYYVTPSGAQGLDFSGISIPSDSGISLPKTLADGKLYVVQIIWSGTIWMLVTVIGGGI